MDSGSFSKEKPPGITARRLTLCILSVKRRKSPDRGMTVWLYWGRTTGRAKRPMVHVATMAKRRKKSPPRSPRPGGRSKSTTKAEERADESVGPSKDGPPDTTRPKISELSEEERKEYFREKKRQSRVRVRQAIKCCEEEHVHRVMQRVDMRARRYQKQPPPCFIFTNCFNHPWNVGFRPYTGKRFSHVMLSLRELLEYNVFPRNPVFIYYTTGKWQATDGLYFVLSESPIPAGVDQIVACQIWKELASTRKDSVPYANRREPVYRLTEVPVDLCRGTKCPASSHGSNRVVLCHHSLKKENRSFSVPCLNCLFGSEKIIAKQMVAYPR